MWRQQRRLRNAFAVAQASLRIACLHGQYTILNRAHVRTWMTVRSFGHVRSCTQGSAALRRPEWADNTCTLELCVTHKAVCASIDAARISLAGRCIDCMQAFRPEAARSTPGNTSRKVRRNRHALVPAAALLAAPPAQHPMAAAAAAARHDPAPGLQGERGTGHASYWVNSSRRQHLFVCCDGCRTQNLLTSRQAASFSKSPSTLPHVYLPSLHSNSSAVHSKSEVWAIICASTGKIHHAGLRVYLH